MEKSTKFSSPETPKETPMDLYSRLSGLLNDAVLAGDFQVAKTMLEAMEELHPKFRTPALNEYEQRLACVLDGSLDAIKAIRQRLGTKNMPLKLAKDLVWEFQIARGIRLRTE